MAGGRLKLISTQVLVVVEVGVELGNYSETHTFGKKFFFRH